MATSKLLNSSLRRIVFAFPTPTNCWIIEQDDGLTLVDCGTHFNHGTIFSIIKNYDKSLRRIIITHAHPDHAGSAARLALATGAVVYAHELDVPFLTGQASVADMPGTIGARLLHGSARALGMLDPPPVKHVEALKDNDKVAGLQVLHTPGHTPGSISLWSSDHKALFVGDNVRHWLTGIKLNFTWFSLKPQELQRSCERYREFPAELILLGHGAEHRTKTAVADLLD
ncbi:MAG: MBL fold metallo-hydrolase [Candidatus Obscuribacterales bacterium]|nr:MBL fold metallo-hydrolase [Candidatus Obscuribacterales bacterium]